MMSGGVDGWSSWRWRIGDGELGAKVGELGGKDGESAQGGRSPWLGMFRRIWGACVAFCLHDDFELAVLGHLVVTLGE